MSWKSNQRLKLHSRHLAKAVMIPSVLRHGMNTRRVIHKNGQNLWLQSIFGLNPPLDVQMIQTRVDQAYVVAIASCTGGCNPRLALHGGDSMTTKPSGVMFIYLQTDSILICGTAAEIQINGLETLPRYQHGRHWLHKPLPAWQGRLIVFRLCDVAESEYIQKSHISDTVRLWCHETIFSMPQFHLLRDTCICVHSYFRWTTKWGMCKESCWFVGECRFQYGATFLDNYACQQYATLNCAILTPNLQSSTPILQAITNREPDINPASCKTIWHEWKTTC